MKAAGGTDVKFVVNTHWHGDHTGGNEPFGKAGAVIIAHNNVRVRMSTEQFMAAFNKKIPPSPPRPRCPKVTFPTRATFHWNGNTVNVVHVENAHTDGDSFVQFANVNVIHTGDTYMKDQYPFIDAAAWARSTASSRPPRRSARADANTKIVPGHGALADSATTSSAFTTCSWRARKPQEADRSGQDRGRSRRGEADRAVRRHLGQGLDDGRTFARFAEESEALIG